MAPEIPGGACPHLRAPVSQPVLPGAAGPWWPSPPSPCSAECHPTLPTGPVPGEGGPAPATGAGESLGWGHGGRAGLRPLWTQTTTAATRRLIQGLGWVPAFCRALCSGLRTQAGQVETPTGDCRQCPEQETHWVLCSLCWQLSGPRGVPERGPLHAIQELMKRWGGFPARIAYAGAGSPWGAGNHRPQAAQGRVHLGGSVLQRARSQAQVWGWGWGGAWAPVIRGPRLPPSGRVPLLLDLGDLCVRPG